MSDYLIHQLAKDRQRALMDEAHGAAEVRKARKERRAARRRPRV
jgi:hypothetical protein